MASLRNRPLCHKHFLAFPLRSLRLCVMLMPLREEGITQRRRDRVGGFILAVFALYLLSYAPFLALTPNSNEFTQYRAPAFYRPAEWIILRTPLQPLLLEWAEWHDVRHTTEIQVLFFSEGVADPATEHDWAL